MLDGHATGYRFSNNSYLSGIYPNVTYAMSADAPMEESDESGAQWVNTSAVPASTCVVNVSF